MNVRGSIRTMMFAMHMSVAASEVEPWRADPAHQSAITLIVGAPVISLASWRQRRRTSE